jgi:hypothetical protein
MTSETGPETGTTTAVRAKTLRFRVTKKWQWRVTGRQINPMTAQRRLGEGEEFEAPAENLEIYKEHGIAEIVAPPAHQASESGGPPATALRARSLRFRIAKKGHGLIPTGTSDPTRNSQTFSEGDEFDAPAENLLLYEEHGIAMHVVSRPEERRNEPASAEVPPLTPSQAPAAALQQGSANAAANVIDAEAMARLAARAAHDEATGCLIWQGSKAHGGYGQITYRRKLHTTHRLAWIAQRGEVPPNHYVCHSCDNPSCIAIGHLFLGTPQDNYRDMRKKGRSRYNCKLETQEVAAIKKRLAQGEPAVKIAKDYAVRYDQILNIKRGVAWREVAAED